jgi:hypothetical protein
MAPATGSPTPWSNDGARHSPASGARQRLAAQEEPHHHPGRAAGRPEGGQDGGRAGRQAARPTLRLNFADALHVGPRVKRPVCSAPRVRRLGVGHELQLGPEEVETVHGYSHSGAAPRLDVDALDHLSSQRAAGGVRWVGGWVAVAAASGVCGGCNAELLGSAPLAASRDAGDADEESAGRVAACGSESVPAVLPARRSRAAARGGRAERSLGLPGLHAGLLVAPQRVHSEVR